MSTGATNGRRRDALETMDGDEPDSEEHTPPLQHAPSEEELAYRTDLITIEAQQHLDSWDEDDLQLFLELLEDAGSELQREMLNRAVAMGHSPTELHSFGDSIRGISDQQLFKQCTAPEDMPVRNAAQMELRLRAEADPFLAFQLNRAPRNPPPSSPGPEPKTVPQAEVVQQAVQQTAKAGLKVSFSLSQSYDGSRPIGPPEPTGIMPAVQAGPSTSAPKGDQGDSVLRSRGPQQSVRLPAALEAKPPPGAPPPTPAAAVPVPTPYPPAQAAPPAAMRPPSPGVASGPSPVSGSRPVPAAGPSPGPGPASAPRPPAGAPGPAGPAASAAAQAPKKEERKGFADDLFNDALKPFGLSLDEHLIDDEKITVEKVLALATESLLKGLPVPVVLGSAKGDHRRYALMLQVVLSPTGRSFQVHDPFAQETVWINDTDLLGLSQLGFTEKTHKRVTAIALAKALGGKLL